MWGDPETALRLDATNPLAQLLLQISGPAHIPWQDQRWQELLHGYNVWVHAECHNGGLPLKANNSETDLGVLDQACRSMVLHAPQSSNLAALTLHVTRMVREVVPVDDQASTGAVSDFSNRIAMVGKARATAGCLNLCKLLTHAVIVQDATRKSQQPQDEEDHEQQYLQECFTYKSRDHHHHPPPMGAQSSSSSSSQTNESDSATDLLSALLHLLSSSILNEQSTVTAIPELYDTIVIGMELLVIMLSTQLYQPMISSFQRQQEGLVNGYFWDLLMRQAQSRQRSLTKPQSDWTPRGLLLNMMDWTVRRPFAPDRSIAHHNAHLARSVVQAKGEKLGADGMYESHMVVSACAPEMGDRTAGTRDDGSAGGRELVATANSHMARRHSNLLLDATKGVLVLSSSIILLPFRLVSLALGLWGTNKEKGYDNAHRRQMQTSLMHANALTKDVLWLSDSPVADLASSLVLLVINNERAIENPFRQEMAALADNRWEADAQGLPDLPDLASPGSNGGSGSMEDSQLGEETAPLVPLAPSPSVGRRQDIMAINFESLFKSFGRTAHSEVGALLLYTLMQSSQSFADSIAVRSDLDTLVLPLLRTLYFSSSTRHFAAAQDFASHAGRRKSTDSASTAATAISTVVSLRSCPFRSQSQLYVIIILLLLFSQDASFGPDAFRRVQVATVPWYKERYIKDLNLGSVLLLCVLRSLAFNLNRLQDAFLLSNCCAILMNLSPAIGDLHEYAAMRLASITVSTMKRYVVLRKENPDVDEEDLSNQTAQHGEVSRTLLRVLKLCLSAKNIERNLNLVYALVYHQGDFKKVTSGKGSPFKKSEIDRVLKVVAVASEVIEKGGESRTAAKALKVLSDNMSQIKEAVGDKKKRSDGDGFTFTYEEEADPEIFFVPYVWEVIVCAVTSSSIEWTKSRIQVFPLLDDPEAIDREGLVPHLDEQQPAIQDYSKDVSDVV